MNYKEFGENNPTDINDELKKKVYDSIIVPIYETNKENNFSEECYDKDHKGKLIDYIKTNADDLQAITSDDNTLIQDQIDVHNEVVMTLAWNLQDSIPKPKISLHDHRLKTYDKPNGTCSCGKQGQDLSNIHYHQVKGLNKQIEALKIPLKVV